MSDSQHPQREWKLRRGTAVHCIGFVVSYENLEEISRGACEEAFRKEVGGGLVFSLQWHVSRHKYELIPLRNGTRDFLFCISFIPYWRTPEEGDSDAIYKRLCTLSEEDKEKWYDIYGKHASIALDEFEIQTICYPTNCAIAQWIPSTVARVILENKDDLKCLVEPVPTLREAIAEFAAIMRASGGRRR